MNEFLEYLNRTSVKAVIWVMVAAVLANLWFRIFISPLPMWFDIALLLLAWLPVVMQLVLTVGYLRDRGRTRG